MLKQSTQFRCNTMVFKSSGTTKERGSSMAQSLAHSKMAMQVSHRIYAQMPASFRRWQVIRPSGHEQTTRYTGGPDYFAF